MQVTIIKNSLEFKSIILSFDNTLELQLNPTSEEKMVKKFSINLVNFIKRLYEAASEFIINNKINYKNIEVNLGWPNIKSNMLLLEESKDISPTIIEYINYIKIKENIIDLKSFEKKQKDEIYERLPLKLKIQIENKISENIKKLFKKDLFELEDMNWFKFNFYDSSYFYFIRLLFQTDIKKIYQEYYVFATRNIDLLFVDKMSEADRTVYYSLIEEENKSRKNNSYAIPNESGVTSLESLINEFEG